MKYEDIETPEVVTAEDLGKLVSARLDANLPDLESNYNRAIELLRSILFESHIESDFDADIYDFLKDAGEVTSEDTCYLDWED